MSEKEALDEAKASSKKTGATFCVVETEQNNYYAGLMRSWFGSPHQGHVLYMVESDGHVARNISYRPIIGSAV